MSAPPLLSVKEVRFSYGPREVLHDISFSAAKGEFIGIVGPNGSGKSTLLRVLGGFLHAGTGTVEYGGVPLSRYDRRSLARSIAVLPRMPDIPFPFSVRDFVAMGRYPHQAGRPFSREGDETLIEEVLETFHLDHLAGRSILDLSEGERQMVFLAQCIVQEPETLLLDEPVSHLDIRHQLRALEALELLHREGMTVLAVLHDLNLTSEFCSRVLLLSAGRLYADGTPGEVLTYEKIEAVYETVVIVRENPLSGRPFVLPVPGRLLGSGP